MKQGKEPRKTISDFGDSGLFRNSSHNNLGLKQSTVIASKRFSNNFEEKTRRLQKNRSFVEINVKTAKKTNKANGGAEKRQGQLSNALTIKKGSRSCLEIKEESIEGDDLESLIPDTPTHDKSNYSKSTVDSESGLNPLRDCFLEKDLMDLNTAELEEKFDLYSLNLERIEILENLMKAIEEEGFKSNVNLPLKIDFTYLRNLLYKNDWDIDSSIKAIGNDMEIRRNIKNKFRDIEDDFFEDIFIFGLDTENCLTICFMADAEEIKDRLFLYLDCLLNSNFNKMQEELKLGNRVNIVLDHQGENVELDLIEYISLLDRSSFPTFLKNLFIFDTDLKSLVKNEQAKKILKSIDIHKKLLILPEKFEEPLFSKIQQTTAITEYKGDLDSPIFELGDILLDSIRMKLNASFV